MFIPSSTLVETVKILLYSFQDLLGLARAELIYKPFLGGFITFGIIAPASAILESVTRGKHIRWQRTGATGRCNGDKVILCNDVPESSGATTIGATTLEVVKGMLPIGGCKRIWNTEFTGASPCIGSRILKFPFSRALVKSVSIVVSPPSFPYAGVMAVFARPSALIFPMSFWILFSPTAYCCLAIFWMILPVSCIVCAGFCWVFQSPVALVGINTHTTVSQSSALIFVSPREILYRLRILAWAIRVTTSFELNWLYGRIRHRFATPLAEGRWRWQPRERRFDFPYFITEQGGALWQN